LRDQHAVVSVETVSMMADTHRDAVGLVRQVSPGGVAAARQLERLLALKDQAQSGFDDVVGSKLSASLRQARALVAFAEEVLER
jgi:hypothetical protein